MAPVKVAIVGAGVSGLSVGVCLTDSLGTDTVDVTILAEKFSSQGITSDGAGGIIRPPLHWNRFPNRQIAAKNQRWIVVTHEWLKQLHSNRVQCGLEELPFFMCYEAKDLPVPWYTELHPEFRALSSEEIAHYNLPSRLNTVWKYNCFCLEVSEYLRYLSGRFRDNGGGMIQRKINNLSELSDDYDIIINCTGLGARELVGDLSVYPVRGQLIKVQGPKIQAVFLNREPQDGNLAYVIPHNGHIILGGTCEKHNWSTEMDPSQTESIYRKCVELCPQLEGCKVIGGWACLRPARDTVRLEVDREFNGPSLLIHNYGHGGKGFCLSWGCAIDVVELVNNHLQLNLTSKL